ncbi:hypothetical protein [Methanobrevibacter sp.]|uniref:hypothetical protein n=1 Tax=Methanobrevibacter sp. TaxID=66852 RepID=UPI003869554F
MKTPLCIAEHTLNGAIATARYRQLLCRHFISAINQNHGEYMNTRFTLDVLKCLKRNIVI